MPILATTKQQRLKLHKKPMMFYIEPEEAEALRLLALRTRVSQSAYVREGIGLVLKKHETGI